AVGPDAGVAVAELPRQRGRGTRHAILGSEQEIVAVGVRLAYREWHQGTRNALNTYVAPTVNPKLRSPDVRPTVMPASSRNRLYVYRAPNRKTLRDSVPTGATPLRTFARPFTSPTTSVAVVSARANDNP